MLYWWWCDIGGGGVFLVVLYWWWWCIIGVGVGVGSIFSIGCWCCIIGGRWCGVGGVPPILYSGQLAGCIAPLLTIPVLAH